MYNKYPKLKRFQRSSCFNGMGNVVFVTIINFWGTEFLHKFQKSVVSMAPNESLKSLNKLSISQTQLRTTELFHIVEC